MSENINSFFNTENDNSFQIFDSIDNIENNSINNHEEYSNEKCSKSDIFKITNYNFLKKKRSELMNKSHKRQNWTTEEVEINKITI